jgi:hypothetical protein
MIPNEKLQEISNIKLKNVFELQEYLKSFKITDIADMAQDLLDLRKENAKLKQQADDDFDKINELLEIESKNMAMIVVLVEWAEYWYEHRTKEPHPAGAEEYLRAEDSFVELIKQVKGE